MLFDSAHASEQAKLTAEGAICRQYIHNQAQSDMSRIREPRRAGQRCIAITVRLSYVTSAERVVHEGTLAVPAYLASTMLMPRAV